MIKGLIAVFLAAILTENYVLAKFLGICPFLGVSKKLNTAVGMSGAVTFVMVLATAVTYPIYMYLLVLVIAGLVQLVEIVLKKYMRVLYRSLGIYLPLITTNCAVLGVTMLVIEKSGADYGFGHALVNALGAGIGFLLAMVMFAGIRGRLETADIPKSLKGLPITLVAASLVSLSFLGFAGLVDNMLGLG